MKKTLVVVDMQNDFIDGSLGTPEAKAIVPRVVDKIKNWDGRIIFTADTHNKYYSETREGRYLPVKHCVLGTYGWHVNDDVYKALKEKDARMYYKSAFCDNTLGELITETDAEYIEFVGLCTDICVITNVFTTRSYDSEVDIAVDASCCAGTSPEMHETALKVMQSCQIEIIR